MDWFRVAAVLGATIDELRSRMSSDEFTRWRAFLSIEPDVGTRLDWNLTAIAQLLGKKTDGRLFDWGRD